MLYVSDFFTRNKEAVSNQIELLANHNSGKIIAATRFMKQKAFHKEDLRDGIVLVPAYLYPFALSISLLVSRRPVHVFEEESFNWKRILLNLSNRPLYVSLYRRPEIEHIQQLQRYKHLRKVFVELPTHKEMLVSHGFDAKIISVTSTPSKLIRRRSKKRFNPKDVNIVFASWNNSEPNALQDRGILYLLDLIAKNPEYSLTIPLRDSKTDEFWKIAKATGVSNRVRLIHINSPSELENMFDNSDFVAFAAQARVVKDVPNSLLDGLAYGKPVIISSVLDFSTTVKQQGIGYVIKAGEAPKRMTISIEEYQAMSKKAYAYSARHTARGYQKSATSYGENDENSNN